MTQKGSVLKVSIVPLIVLGLFSFFSTFLKTSNVYESIRVHEEMVYNFPSLDVLDYKEDTSSILYFQNDFLGFKEALAFKESQGRYKIVNRYGYMGKYQFGVGTLALVGVYDSKKFLNSPLLQEKAFIANLSRNKWVLRKYIQSYAGKKVGGIEITESGILAAAHLAGPKSVKRYLSSNGTINFKDGFETSLKEYLQKFSDYDVSIVPQNKKAKATQESLLYI